MKKSIAIAGFAMAVITAFAATPASATVTLPTGDKLIAIPCASNGDPVNNLNQVDSTGATTPIGTQTYSNTNCFADGSYNQVDGKFYAWDWNTEQLFTVDVTTGVQTVVGDGTLSLDGSNYRDVNAVLADLTGNIYVSSGNTPSNLYSVALGATSSDPSVLTLIGALPANVSAMAVNPVDEKVYAQDPNGDLYQVSLTDGSEIASYPTNCGTNEWGHGYGDCWGLDFDSTGNLWYETDDADSDGNSMLASAAVPATNGTSFELVQQGVYTDATTGGWYGESSAIIWAPAAPTPAPTLAATGSDFSGLTGGSIALVLAGLVTVVATNRRKATK